MGVSVLFVQERSIYKILGVDCYDQLRDAKTFCGDNPIIAHPPCAQWSRLRKLAKVDPNQKALAPWSVDLIRKNGGVLEHPAFSELWKFKDLPLPGSGPDQYGGFSISVDQHWYGHKAKKSTWLYIVGCNESQLPPVPISLDAITHTVSSQKPAAQRAKKELSKQAASATPKAFAVWLIQLASIIEQNTSLTFKTAL